METKKKACKYGAECFRKNTDHMNNYEHDENKKPTKRANNEEPECTKKVKCDDQNIEKIDLSKHDDIRSLVTEQNNGMEMPDDFYDLYELCKSLNPTEPKHALKAIDVELTGIYDFLLSGLKLNYKTHARFYYDPPEFQTCLVVTSSDTQLHIGYFRDDPNKLPDFVASNEPNQEHEARWVISCRGDNLFSAIVWLCDQFIADKAKCNDEIKALKKSIVDYCTAHKPQRFSLEAKSARIKARDKKVNSKTFNTAGICVHVNENGVGYREVPETNDKQKKLFADFCCVKSNDNGDAAAQERKRRADEKLQEIITFIQFANDEMDYGMGLEFGLNMFSYGHIALHKFIRCVLPNAYTLLGRDIYADILKEHLKLRKQSSVDNKN